MLVLLTATIPEVYVFTMTIFISDSYYHLQDTLTHLNGLKINSYTGDNVTYFWAAIMVDVDFLGSTGTFKPENIG